MSSNSVPFSELNTKLIHQLQLVESLEHELNALKDANKHDWRIVIKQCLSNIRDHIEDLGNRQTQLTHNNLILKNKVFHLHQEIAELTTARRKLSPYKPPKVLSSVTIHPMSPIQPISPIPIEKIYGFPSVFTHQNCAFASLKNAMADSTQINKIAQILGFKTLPEMVFPDSYLKISFPNSLEMEFSAINGLKPCLGIPSQPKRVQVQYATEWKSKAKNSRDVEHLQFDYDWTFTTNYSGDYKSLKVREEHDSKSEEGKYKELKVEKNVKERFNMVLLRDTSMPILWSCHCILYEDELSDNGMSQLLVRCRVMEDGFLVLLRYWLRVDNVIIRVNDTRIFHEFGKDFVLRHYQEREAKWPGLSKKFSVEELLQFNDPNAFADKIHILNSVYDKIYL